MDIPDLPGVAGDVNFSLNDDFLEVSSKPAKKVVSKPVLEEPKPHIEEPIREEPPKVQVTVPEVKIPTPAPRSQPSEPATPSIPPPPPPPMAGLSAEPVKKPLPDLSAARSNLMAAIRSAGSKSLRAAADRVPAEPKKKEKAPPAGDLMSDLRNRLTMRRKGISGAKDQQPDGLMSKVSMMIPPPPLETSTEKTEESDEDWN